MTEDIVQFNTAKLLKEKGFDIITHSWYNKDGSVFLNQTAFSDNTSNRRISAPTQALAQKWLREVHSIYVNVTVDLFDDLETLCFRGYEILPMKNFSSPLGYSEEVFRTYEEALEAGIKEALNLIEDET